MKANGKNLKLFLYFTHDYMDEHPEQHLRSMETTEMMNEFIVSMKDHWCSGTVSDAEELSPKRLYEVRKDPYWKGYEEAIDNFVLDAPQEFVKQYEDLLFEQDALIIIGG